MVIVSCVKDMIEACPIYMFVICVFELLSKLLSNTTPRFLADADGFVS